MVGRWGDTSVLALPHLREERPDLVLWHIKPDCRLGFAGLWGRLLLCQVPAVDPTGLIQLHGPGTSTPGKRGVWEGGRYLT